MFHLPWWGVIAIFLHRISAISFVPAGIAIPIGLPVLFVIGGWMFMEGQKEEEAGDKERDVQGVVEEYE